MLLRSVNSTLRTLNRPSQSLILHSRLPRLSNVQIRASYSNLGPSLAQHPQSASSVLRTLRLSRYQGLQSRSVSTGPLPAPKSKILRFCYRTAAGFGFFIACLGASVVVFFIYDATTYKEDGEVEDVSVPELALNPRRGGPKNLPIVDFSLDDEDCDENRAVKHKPRLVILGTGWGSVALLKTLNPGDYNVTVISPSNHFLFTPMLPSATVGTLELRSLIEPVRGIVRRVRGHFMKAMAEDVEFSEKLVEVSAVGQNGEKKHFYVPYDKLIIGVGKQDTKLRHCH
jgi:NADH:ubiquinone reductase (H+-translocating)